MVQVKALRPHDNAYGKNYHKAKGDEYDHPAPQPLVDNKLVEIVDGDKNDKGRGASGAGAGPAKSAEGDG